MKTVVSFCLTFEKGFNILGYVPFIGTLSGLIRIALAGVIQLFIGLVCFLVGVVSAMLMTLFRQREMRVGCISLARFGSAMLVHTRLNILRGLIELIPFLGGLLLIVYDRTFKGQQLVDYYVPVKG